MISQKIIKENNLTREDVIKIIMRVTGKSQDDAEFLYAIEMGEIDGDLLEVDEQGNPVKEN